VIGANISAQITGQSFGSKYGVIFLKEIGTVDPFVLNVVNNALFILIVAASMLLIDRFGRRPILLTGSFLQAASMLIVGGFATMTVIPTSYRAGMSAMLTIFYGGFCFGWAPIYHILTSEIPNSRMRDMTYTVASVCTVVTQFTVTFTIPYLYYAPYAALGPKIGFIFGSTSFATFLFAFLCVPECRKLTLEEVDYLFIERTKIWDFRKFKHGSVIPEAVTDLGEKTGAVVEQKEVAASA
jgi:MFS transporter, SP family, sugar:H+ symporter